MLVALWEDLLARSDLPPQAAGVTSGEYELATMMAAESIPVVAEPAEWIWVWSDLHLGDQAALKAFRRPFPLVQVMTARLLAAWRRTVPDGDLVILRLKRELQAEVFTYPMRRRIPTVNVAVAMTVPTIQRTSLVSRFAIPVRCSVRCSVRSSAICVESRVSRLAISARTSARPALN